ncbi:MAG: GNAT family N-acetyltransferase, partial [Thermoplasmata archaeon]|nr:GNAT family N-acetyltransferase [Thermoplasmata archaeon]
FDYRLFEPGDLFEVMGIVNQELGYDYSPDVYLDLHRAWPEGFIVVSYYRKIVGFILTCITPDRAVRILLLVMRKEFQSRGIGRKLMDIIINKAMIKRLYRVTLEVRVENEKAITFYQDFGMRIVARTPRFYKDGGDAFVMEKVLSS